MPDSSDYATRSDVRRIEDKLDFFITRTEHTQSVNTQTQLSATLAAQIIELGKQVERNRETVELANKEGGKWLLDQFDKLETKIITRLDTHIENHGKNNQWLIGLIYGTGSAIAAGIAIALVQHYIH